MGFQDRDYYREWWAKKEGYVEKTPFRMNLGKMRRRKEWHPVLVFLATFFLCAVVFGLLKFLVWIQA